MDNEPDDSYELGNEPDYYYEDDGEPVGARCPSCGGHDSHWDCDHWKCEECSCVWEEPTPYP